MLKLYFRRFRLARAVR